MNHRAEDTLKEVIGLVLGYGLLLQIVLFFLSERRIYVSVGLWLGIALAVYMVVYMYRILESELGEDAKFVQKHVLMHSVIRYISVAVIFGIVIIAHLGNPLSCFAGVMGLKVAAMLQPCFHRLIRKNKKNEYKEVE